MKTTNDVRSIFLKNFMREILINMPKEETNVLNSLSEKNISSITTIIKHDKEASTAPSSTAPSIKRSIHPAFVPEKAKFPLSPIKPFRPLPYNVPPILLRQRPPTPKIYLAQPTESWLVNLQSLKRIQPLLIDKTITSIECSGPGMPIMIARGTYAQSTPIHFTVDEINKIIKEISERTKIPLNASGIFKAAIGDIIIAAVLSEFVGTRFVIQKKAKSPQQPPIPSRRQ